MATEETKTRTVYILDDNDDFRNSTVWMLEAFDYQVFDFSEPENAIDSIVKFQATKSACLLLDIRMPKMSGLDVHELLIQRGIAVPVVYMTGHADVPLAVEAMKKGAVTFLEKPLQQDALESALDLAFAKARTVSLGRNSGVCNSELAEFSDALENLTQRETEIMHAIVDGKTNKNTASDLGISVKTVELHRARVMKKLPISSAQELVKKVLMCKT